jgi:hypothetical protein
VTFRALQRDSRSSPAQPETKGANDVRFRTTIIQSGKTATGIRIRGEIVEALGAGKRPPVSITINGYTYRSTVAVLGGDYMVGVSAENRAGAGVAGGDEVDVEIELDTAPRQVDLPADFVAALDAQPGARRTFDGLSYSNQSWRRRRIAKSIQALKEGLIR